MQDELIRLLKLSPTLTTVVVRDPSLLSNPDYIRRNNPELAQFLEAHPEIATNPDFYLFTHLDSSLGGREQAFERKVWPELPQSGDNPSSPARVMESMAPIVIFLCVTGVLIWLTRLFVENRRWGRIFKQQMEVHSRLIDKFASTQELHTYMETEAGRRFLEAAPIPVGFEPEPAASRMPSAVARVLISLQAGIVMALLGVGFLGLRNSRPDMHTPMQVLGTIFLMPGIGFILSAGITWLLAGRLGMLPGAPTGRLGDRLAPLQSDINSDIRL